MRSPHGLRSIHRTITSSSGEPGISALTNRSYRKGVDLQYPLCLSITNEHFVMMLYVVLYICLKLWEIQIPVIQIKDAVLLCKNKPYIFYSTSPYVGPLLSLSIQVLSLIGFICIETAAVPSW